MKRDKINHTSATVMKRNKFNHTSAPLMKSAQIMIRAVGTVGGAVPSLMFEKFVMKKSKP